MKWRGDGLFSRGSSGMKLFKKYRAAGCSSQQVAESPVFLANATRVKLPLSPVGEPNGMRHPPFATKMQQVETTNTWQISLPGNLAIAKLPFLMRKSHSWIPIWYKWRVSFARYTREQNHQNLYLSIVNSPFFIVNIPCFIVSIILNPHVGWFQRQFSWLNASFLMVQSPLLDGQKLLRYGGGCSSLRPSHRGLRWTKRLCLNPTWETAGFFCCGNCQARLDFCLKDGKTRTL